MHAIQGADLLDQENQLPGFRALCGLGEHKPFECVGSIAESRAAMKLLSGDPRWQAKHIIQVLGGLPEIQRAGELELQPDIAAAHCIPAAVMARIDAFL